MCRAPAHIVPPRDSLGSCRTWGKAPGKPLESAMTFASKLAALVVAMTAVAAATTAHAGVTRPGSGGAHMPIYHGQGSIHNPIVFHPVHGPGSSHNPIVFRPVHGPGSSHNPIVSHPLHGSGSSHNPIVVYPVHGPGSSHNPIICWPGARPGSLNCNPMSGRRPQA